MTDARDAMRGLIAEFATDGAIVDAARALCDSGYRQLDAFVPRPVEALEELIAPRRSNLPRSVLIGAVLGAISGLGVEWFCNAWDYPLNVGGRPPFSLPAFIPITFEILVLFGSLTAFFGVLHRMRLPRLTDPVFEVHDFESASIDHFWLYVGADDPRFRAAELEELLPQHGCLCLRWTRHAEEPLQTAPLASGMPEQVAP
jgi:hypothetical protein